MTELTLAKSLEIIDSALAKSKELGLKPLAVAVLDAGGHLKAFQREDGASMMRFEIASGKAYGAIALRRRIALAQCLQAETRPHFLEGLSAVSGGKIVAVPGGVLVKDPNGRDHRCRRHHRRHVRQ